MTGHRSAANYRYDIGEEVVLRLAETRVFQVEGDALQLWAMPGWTIAEIVAITGDDYEHAYEVRFRHAGGFYRCTISERAIDGIA